MCVNIVGPCHIMPGGGGGTKGGTMDQNVKNVHENYLKIKSQYSVKISITRSKPVCEVEEEGEEREVCSFTYTQVFMSYHFHREHDPRSAQDGRKSSEM